MGQVKFEDRVRVIEPPVKFSTVNICLAGQLVTLYGHIQMHATEHTGLFTNERKYTTQD